MKFTVLWVPAAEEEPARIWIEAADRLAVNIAAQKIDESLAVDPDNHGESRNAGRRILLIPPLGVVYRIDRDRRRVYVLITWSFEKRDP